MSTQPPAPAPTTTSDPAAGRSRRLRLAVVSDAVLPWNQGGKEQRHHELYVRLARRGFEVTVYTMHWWDGPRRTHRDGITYVALCRRRPLYTGGRRSIRQAVVFALACLKLLWQRFDVVEADAIPFLPLVPVRLVTWLRRKPMVTTWYEFWGRDYWRSYLGPLGVLAALVEENAVRLPTRIIAVSEETAERLRAAPGGPQDVVVVPGGVDVRTDLGGDQPRGDERPLLLTAGRLLENKKVDVAVRAVDELRSRGTDVRLEVVGDGPELPALERLVAELRLEAQVRFTSFLPDHEAVLVKMADADLLVFPSVREGFGMVALEAMSVGTPVVTSDHRDNAARHLVQPGVNGHVVTPTPTALADGIAAALAQQEDLESGARATAEAYGWDRLTSQAADVYRLAAS